jgi:hypothetical protein
VNIESEIAAQIDDFVYELYAITDAERKIIEGSPSRRQCL